jgi:hypothetical protein
MLRARSLTPSKGSENNYKITGMIICEDVIAMLRHVNFI